MAGKKSASVRAASAAREPRAAAPKPTAAPQAAPPGPARVAVELNPLIHDRVRLALLSALAVSPALSFNELKDLTEASDGNLAAHARRLEEAGLLAVAKGFSGRRPLTLYRLTEQGRAELEDYWAAMEFLLARVRKKRT